MTPGGHFRGRTAIAIEALLENLPEDDAEKAVLTARARVYAQECGCAMGGSFLAAALAMTLIYVVITRDLSVRTCIASIALIFVASVLGKVTGIWLAWVKLVLLRRSLARRQVGMRQRVLVH